MTDIMTKLSLSAIWRSLFFLLLLAGSQSIWANPCLVLLPSSSPNFVRQKLPSFPSLSAKALNAFKYDKEVELGHPRDQCVSGCSFNSTSNYLEAMDSFARTGKVKDKDQVQFSANYMHAQNLISFFESALRRRVRDPIAAGGWIERNILRALKDGVVLEKDFPSRTDVDVAALVEYLNQNLAQLDKLYSERFLPEEVVEQNLKRAKDLISSAFGSVSKTASLYSLNHLQKPVLFLNFESETMTTISPGSVLRDRNSVSRAGLLRVAEHEIRQELNQGRPVLFGYAQINQLLNSELGLLSLAGDDGSGSGPGHAALIIGYHLDGAGNMDMLKVKNSHANAPILNMTMDYFKEMVSSLAIIKTSE